MNKHNTELIKQHIENKEAYDSAYERDRGQQEAVNLAIEGVKKMHREAKHLYYNTGDPADEQIMDFRKFNAHSNLTDSLDVKVDTEDEVKRSVRYATEDYQDNKDAIHAWAQDEYTKVTSEASKIPVQAIDEAPVTISVEAK